MTKDKTEIHKSPSLEKPSGDYVEFEIGKDKVPWFLWLFFAFIITWASVSWMKLFGY